MKSYNSYAKINLFLNITKIYKNSYHQIKSIFCQIDLCDTIQYEKNSSLQVRVFDKSNVLPSDNLLIKGANKFIQHIKNIPFGIDFYIEKKIPIGGGLGGGSSNAAFVLKTLNKLWGIRFGNKKLERIGSSIGADVPFFIKGGVQAVYGIGNITKKIKIKNKIFIPILLVMPDIKISTKEAYSLLDEKKIVYETFIERKMFKNIKKGFIKGDFDLIVNNVYNKFEKVIFDKYPEFKKIEAEILKSNAIKSIMSGSGSTMIGIYKDIQSLNQGYIFLKDKGYNVVMSKIIY